MARFLDDLLLLLNRLRAPSTERDPDSVSASPADSLTSLAESNDFRVIPHLLRFSNDLPNPKSSTFTWPSGVTITSEMMKPSTGAGDETLIAKAPSTYFIGMTDWSRDGRFILVDKAPVDIWVIPTEVGKQPFPFIDSTQYQERIARFSPDGRWVVYQSNESGRAEIYIRPFSESGATASGAGQWQVSTAGGAQPRWSRDGREVYWIAPDAKLMAAPITVSGNSVEPGTPVVLFQTRSFLGGLEEPHRGQFAIAPDGRFLINTVLDDAGSPPITVVQNWQPK